MLPAGMIRIDRSSFDALADGEAIEKGENVVVKGVRMKRLVIRKAAPNEPSRPSAPGPDEASDDLLDRPIDEFGIESWDEA